ncbi:MAG: YiiX family permuted papain-like enzyme [Cryomorphaceae bacterium]|nr:YiiX family permuted papain-like enzyme [Cryomorphaceae bacterium]
MRKFTAFILTATVSSALIFGFRQPLAEPLQSGDLVFQVSKSEQSEAIQKATGSKYSHVGIVFFEGDLPYVYEAVGPVRKIDLDHWRMQGTTDEFAVKRLKNAAEVLTAANLKKLQSAGKRFAGLPYDFKFEWSDDKIYCSELVWKIYHEALGIELCKKRKLSDYNLKSKVVQRTADERYDGNLPLNEVMVSPGDLFESELLRTVEHKHN